MSQSVEISAECVQYIVLLILAYAKGEGAQEVE